MFVELCYQTEDMEKDKIKVCKRMKVPQAIALFKELNKDLKITKAYLRRFDGWHYYIHRKLKVIE